MTLSSSCLAWYDEWWPGFHSSQARSTICRSLFFILFVFRLVPAIGQGDTAVVHSLFLVGDAGEHDVIDAPIGDVLKQSISAAGEQATVVFLGDNVYPEGLSGRGSKSFEREQSILLEQAGWVANGARGIFIPGNHDWQHWGKKGLQYLKNQQNWFDSLRNPLFGLFPRDNCPGPVEIPLPGPNLLVLLDTQWFLHKWEKPGIGSACAAQTPAQVVAQLDSVLTRNPDKRIIIAGHHPLLTYGDHGGVFTLKDHLFPLTDVKPYLFIPLPVVGSIYPLYRKFIGHRQDTRHPAYRRFRDPIEALLRHFPSNLYVSGHEHALEYMVRDDTHMIVSGSAAKHTSVKRKGYARFVASTTGFARADLRMDGSIALTFIQVDLEHPDGIELYRSVIPPMKRL